MNITFHGKKAVGFFISVFLIFLFSHNVYSAEMAYTIQTGSFVNESDAEKQFDRVIKKLPDSELDGLRIEKIGKYHSVRIGTFHDHASAKILLAKVKDKFASAMIIHGYIKEDRVVIRYNPQSLHEEDKTDKKPSFNAQFPKGLIYTIQTGSFPSEARAHTQFDSIVNRFQDSDFDYIRIERIGKHYCLRIGNFEKRKFAEETYNAVKAEFPNAIMMDAYIKEQRIVKLHRNESFASHNPTELNPAQKQVSAFTKPPIVKRKHEKARQKNGRNIDQRAAQETEKKSGINHKIEAKGTESIKENPVKQDKLITGTTKPQENNNGNNQSKSHAELTMKEDSLPDLFYNEKKPPIKENLKRKIEPNSERKGDMYVEKKQYFRALEEYRRTRHKRPILRRKMAILLYRMGFVDEAISEMTTVVDLSPTISADRMMLGTLYLAKGNTSKAKEQFIDALEINPGYTYAYRYLAEIFLKEKEYDMAWLSAKMARRLGYKGEGLINELRSVSSEPIANLWSITEDGLSLRLILVNTYNKATNILDRIKEGELFETIAGNESVGAGRNAGGFLGRLSPSEVVAEIFSAMHNQDAYSEPVIVKTKEGYHIVQKIISFDINNWKRILAESGKADMLTVKTHR